MRREFTTNTEPVDDATSFYYKFIIGQTEKYVIDFLSGVGSISLRSL